MLFLYKATDKENHLQDGNIDAPGIDLAIASLQRRGLIILDINPADQGSFWSRHLSFSRQAKLKDVVFLSRQLATLFEAKVSALASFRLLASEAEHLILRRALVEITDDVNGGVQISAALAKHPEVFSDFYVNMVKAGEESGKLSEGFTYLAAYLERSHALISKARNSLIYPAFVIASFIGVMILMVTLVIPKLGEIIKETGQEVPFYTQAILTVSNFFVNYWFGLLIFLAILGFFVGRYIRTPAGRASLSSFKLSIPYVSDLFQKLYLARISDNLSTMLMSGISMVRALEITADVVGNDIYKKILLDASESVKAGGAVSAVFYRHPEIPGVMIQMIKVGEEAGKLGYILQTLSRFYEREVYNAVETLVDLIEPAMIVILGLGVGVLLTAVLVPIYNIAGGI
ncbi:MAG: type II secretion system F family protein [Candidatus Vogelbacteria bacterium]|nr:type II secretion system F family protein [Candidatus Vogelbacteria bacterium]